MEKAFGRFARTTSNLIGSPITFALAVMVVLLWGLSGPFFGFSDTWQLIINTLTTITTGLIVFVIQYTQNKDTKVLHTKLDELLIAVQSADARVAELEDQDADVIEAIRQEHHRQIEG